MLNTVQREIQKSRKVVLITGAGISCNAGIPDFRSTDGLYNLVKQRYPDAAVKGKDLFDTVLFSNSRSIEVFYSFMAALRQQILQARPTSTHRFIHFLKCRKKLLRCYTQNIDNLEAKVVHTDNDSTTEPVPPLTVGVEAKQKPDVVQLHGDIERLRCMLCTRQYEWFEEAEKLCAEGTAPTCPSCMNVQQERIKAGKRDTGVGSLRPDIVLYGEEHPDGDAIARCSAQDLRANPDCLIIMGTSLKVTGIRRLTRTLAKAVKARGGICVLVNASDLSASQWDNVIDYHIKGDCDDWIETLRQRDFFRIQKRLNFGVTKPSLARQKKAKGEGKNTSNTDYPSEAARKMSSMAKKMISPPCTPQKPRLPTAAFGVIPGDGNPEELILTPSGSPSQSQTSFHHQQVLKDVTNTPTKRKTQSEPEYIESKKVCLDMSSLPPQPACNP